MIKKRIAVSMALIFVFFLFMACASVEYQVPTLEPDRIMDKNYEIDKPQRAYAGDKMMEAKNYAGLFTTHKKIKALNDFSLEGPGVEHAGAKGDLYDIILTAEVNEQYTYFIEIPGAFRRYAIDEDGNWRNVYYIDGPIQKARTPITPRDTTFEFVEETRIFKADSSKFFTYFEIVFTGKTQDAIHLLYREYEPDSLEEPAFQENLSYPIDAEIIRYDQIEIKIHEAADESISYTVLEDGLDRWNLYKNLCNLN